MKSAIKVLALSTVLMLTTGQVYGQKCKYDYNKKDEFTGKETKGISAVINKWFALGFNKLGDSYDMGMVLNAYHNDISPKGDSIMLKIVSDANPNGSTIVLYSLADTSPVIQGNAQYNRVTATASAIYLGVYSIKYGITKEQLELLSSGLVTDVRIHLGGKDFDVSDLKAKASKKLQQASSCILQ